MKEGNLSIRDGMARFCIPLEMVCFLEVFLYIVYRRDVICTIVNQLLSRPCQINFDNLAWRFDRKGSGV